MAARIVEEFSKYNKKYRLVQKCISFKLADLPSNTRDPEAFLKKEFQDIVNYLASNIDKEDKVGFTFTSANLERDAFLSFRKAKDVSFEVLWKLLGSIYQSNSEGFNTETFKMTATVIKPYKGLGRVRVYKTFDEESRKRRGIIQISNKDNLCLVRALVVAMAYVMNVPYLSQIRRNVGKKQDKEVEKLLAESGVQIPPEGAGFNELSQFQTFLKTFKITVYEYGFKGRNVLFQGNKSLYNINLLFHQSHYNVITNLTAAFVCRYYCESCHVPYNNLNGHRCEGSCACCQQSPPCEKTASEVYCDKCNRNFRGQVCFDNHTKKCGNGSLCENVLRCSDCLKTYRKDKGREHICGEMYCKTCRGFKPSDHYCYMRPDKRTPKLNDTIFLFFDLESRFEYNPEANSKTHIPVLCVSEQRCDKCIDEENMMYCVNCGLRRLVIDNDVIPVFLNHVISLRKRFKNVIVLAHYGQAFDLQFVLKYLIEETDFKVNVIMRGTKIILLEVDKVKFIDSFSYLPMPLSALPGAFDLKELKKGYFPHGFNLKSNENYIGSLPDKSYYCPDDMSPAKRHDFLEWYEKHKGDSFNFKNELVTYCVSDVDILLKTCLKFRNMFLQECNVCPFTEAITLPSACNLMFRRNFLENNRIGIIPHNGYRNKDNQSKIALLWLIREEEERRVKMQYSLRGREAVVSGMKVDGKIGNTLLEFNGCLFHGCLSCYPIGRDAPFDNDPSDTLETRYEKTVKKVSRLRQLGYEVIEMWECEFRRELNQNKELYTYLKNHPLLAYEPLNPRDAFYGGRTGNTRTYYKTKGNEKIKYVDVTSLYPWVCKYGKFPIGHPKVFVGEECMKLNLSETEGLIKCKVLPPQDLYHPVLPVKENDKLLFALCNSCCLEMNKNKCEHTAEERALIGTWVLDEIKLALKKGYKIMDVYEVWVYDICQYNSVKKTVGLFTEMMNKFVKIKTQASGFPADCATEEEKNTFIENFLERENIQLDYKNIVKNPGLRSLAKLILNSFWGKLGQRENMSKTSIIRHNYELDKLLYDHEVEVNDIKIINEETVLASWCRKEEAITRELPTVNVCIAAYTTAQARLKLYHYLDLLETRVLYYDTDSIIYVSKDGEYEVPIGNFLGDMTNELAEYGPGSYITEFASGGPKNYSFKGFSPSENKTFEVCKVKGIRMSFANSSILNLNSMKEIVLAETPETIKVCSNEIRTTKTHEVINKTTTKMYRACSEKRKFSADHNSVPYGYKKQKD